MAFCEPLSTSAAFIVGLAGSAHCLAMCGGLSSAFALRAGGTGSAGPRRPVLRALLTLQAGRITSYVLAGALVGAFGRLLVAFFGAERLALLLRTASGLVLLAIAATLLTRWRPLGGLERAGVRLWRHLAPLARRIRAPGLAGTWLLGMLWAGLPCGFLYTMLLFAALRGSATQGAALLGCFGLGTLPALLGASLLCAHLPRLVPRVALPRIAGWALLACGAWTVLGPWVPGHRH